MFKKDPATETDIHDLQYLAVNLTPQGTCCDNNDTQNMLSSSRRHLFKKQNYWKTYWHQTKTIKKP